MGKVAVTSEYQAKYVTSIQMYILMLGKLKKQASLWPKLGINPIQIHIFGKNEAVTESFNFEKYVKRITEQQAIIALDGFIETGWNIAWNEYKKRYNHD